MRSCCQQSSAAVIPCPPSWRDIHKLCTDDLGWWNPSFVSTFCSFLSTAFRFFTRHWHTPNEYLSTGNTKLFSACDVWQADKLLRKTAWTRAKYSLVSFFRTVSWCVVSACIFPRYLYPVISLSLFNSGMSVTTLDSTISPFCVYNCTFI